MDNYYHECPPMMDDGRLFTDYRSSQVREELFRYKNCIASENEARSLRIDNADQIMDDEWNHLRCSRSCFPRSSCFHQTPMTRVTTVYNNAELLAYNGEEDIPAPKCNYNPKDFRLTITEGSMRQGNVQNSSPEFNGYPKDRCPRRCTKTNRIPPEKLYVIDDRY